jgi:NAD(P)-dependent dehydrogenase (short-subunit alcohol dehydrogenase family)
LSTTAGDVGTRSVILTGASRGLGAALFHALHRDGARLLALARTFTTHQRRLAATDPDMVTLRSTDLRDVRHLPSPAELTAFLEPCGPDDEIVLVHNAATIEPLGLVGAISQQAMVDTAQVNLVAPMLLTNAFLSAVPSQLNRPRVVYVGSSAARRPYPGWAAYCATKAGAEVFMRCVGEAASRRCVVDVIDPGAMETQMQQTIRDSGVGLPGHQRFLHRHQLGQIAEASDVASRIVAQHFPPRQRMATP